MALTPFKAFEEGIHRAEYLVELYELINNTRQRRIRSDWATSFINLMHWNQTDQLERVDGDGCIIVLRNPSQWTMQHFEHEYLAELLRAALVFAVSTMDRYFHDLVIAHLLILLRRNTPDIPKRLADFPMRLADVEAAIEHALRSRSDDGTATRPRTTLKDCFETAIHKCTFQSPPEIEDAFRMLGIRKIWGKLGQRMSGTAEQVCDRLNKIVHRRNQIVHEGDVKRSSRARSICMNDIVATKTREDIVWIKKLIEAADRVAQDEL